MKMQLMENPYNTKQFTRATTYETRDSCHMDLMYESGFKRKHFSAVMCVVL
jgi:hypothetical protein